MRCRELINKLEMLSPRSYAEAWDNPGLLTGRYEKEIGKVMVALDATDEVIEEAVEAGVDFLLTHHPLIFSARKQINDDDFIGRRLVKLLGNDICCYAMHTNFDVMGMADAAADELSICEREVLCVTYEDDISKEGCGRVGKLPKRMSVADLAAFVKARFHVPNVRVFGDMGDIVEVAAVMPGSGGSYIKNAVNAGADVMITGDIDHHEGIDAVAQGLTIIDAGHYGIEKIFISYMEDFMKRELPELCIYKTEIKEPFAVI